mmetsp:Transcript_30870/g.42422  ORF Transcript_30870/g.42422 Transcript_30870/m.42422 type:complete len:1008 (-) Transcript_30870:77-3100(-)
MKKSNQSPRAATHKLKKKMSISDILISPQQPSSKSEMIKNAFRSPTEFSEQQLLLERRSFDFELKRYDGQQHNSRIYDMENDIETSKPDLNSIQSRINLLNNQNTVLKLSLQNERKIRNDLENRNRDLSEKLQEAMDGLQDSKASLLKIQSATKEMILKRDQREDYLQKVVNFNRIYKVRVKELQDEIASNTNLYKNRINELQTELALRISATEVTTEHSCYKDQIISDLKIRNEKLLTELSYLAADFEEQRYQSSIELTNVIAKQQILNNVVKGGDSSKRFRNNNHKDDDTIEEDDELKKRFGLDDDDLVPEEVTEEDGLQRSLAKRTLHAEMLDLKQQLLNLVTDKQQMEMRLLALEVQQPPLQVSPQEKEKELSPPPLEMSPSPAQTPLKLLRQPSPPQETMPPLQQPQSTLQSQQPTLKVLDRPPQSAQQEYSPSPLPVKPQAVEVETKVSKDVEVLLSKENGKKNNSIVSASKSKELIAAGVDKVDVVASNPSRPRSSVSRQARLSGLKMADEPVEQLAKVDGEKLVGSRHNSYDEDEFEDVTTTVESVTTAVIPVQSLVESTTTTGSDDDDVITLEPPEDGDEGLDDLLAFTEAAMAEDSIKASNVKLLKSNEQDTKPLQLVKPTEVVSKPLSASKTIPGSGPTATSQPQVLEPPLQLQSPGNTVASASSITPVPQKLQFQVNAQVELENLYDFDEFDFDDRSVPNKSTSQKPAASGVGLGPLPPLRNSLKPMPPIKNSNANSPSLSSSSRKSTKSSSNTVPDAADSSPTQAPSNLDSSSNSSSGVLTSSRLSSLSNLPTISNTSATSIDSIGATAPKNNITTPIVAPTEEIVQPPISVKTAASTTTSSTSAKPTVSTVKEAASTKEPPSNLSAVLYTSAASQLQEELEQLNKQTKSAKQAVNQFTASFLQEHNRKPNKNERKQHAKELYKSYHRITREKKMVTKKLQQLQEDYANLLQGKPTVGMLDGGSYSLSPSVGSKSFRVSRNGDASDNSSDSNDE